MPIGRAPVGFVAADHGGERSDAAAGKQPASNSSEGSEAPNPPPCSPSPNQASAADGSSSASFKTCVSVPDDQVQLSSSTVSQSSADVVVQERFRPSFAAILRQPPDLTASTANSQVKPPHLPQPRPHLQPEPESEPALQDDPGSEAAEVIRDLSEQNEASSRPATSLSSRSDMAGPGPSLTSQARAAELNAATAARARLISGELSDPNDLPSAQPVSLGALLSRHHSRNKGSKPWKPFPIADFDELVDTEAVETIIPFQRPRRPVDRYHPPVHPTTPQPQALQHSLSRGEPIQVYRPTYYSGSEIEFPSRQEMGIYQHLQGIPVGQFKSFGGVEKSALAQGYTFQNSDQPENQHEYHPTGRLDITPHKQEDRAVVQGFQATAALQPGSGFQNDGYQAQDYNQMYPVFGMPMGSRPLMPDQFTYYPSQYYPAHDEYHDVQAQIDAAVRFPRDSQQSTQTPVRSKQDVGKTQPKLAPLNVNVTSHRARHRSLESARSSNEYNIAAKASADVSPKSKEQMPMTKQESPEEISQSKSYVDQNLEASNIFNSEKFALDDPFTPEQESASSKKLEPPFWPIRPLLRPVERYEPLVNKDDQSVFASKQSRLVELSKISTESTFQTFEHGLKVFRSRSYPPDILNDSEKGLGGKTIIQVSGIGSVQRPPPGLAIPGLGPAPRPTPWDPQFGQGNRGEIACEKLLSADRWFHTDNRGPAAIFRQVHELAEDEVVKRTATTGSEQPEEGATNTELKTLLLGNVIANLTSYVVGDRKEQSANFARYGPVDSRCCEPSFGGRHSYFDRDPSIGQWRKSTRRTTTLDAMIPGRFASARRGEVDASSSPSRREI